MAKFKNVSGEDLIVGPLGGRLVIAGQVVEIPDPLASDLKWDLPFWEPQAKKKPTSGTDNNQED